MAKYSKYFTQEEYACPCCGESEMDDNFVERLDSLRWKINRPLILNSAYRCDKKNKEVGGVKGSAHTKGLAVDIRCSNSQERYQLLKWAYSLGFSGIGIADTFIHIDDKKGDPRPNSWLYSK